MGMAEIRILGTAASVPDAEHDTVGLLLCAAGRAVPIDCGGSPLHRLARAGIEPDELHALFLTHGHADHIYGLPMLAQGLWLAGRQAPLPIFGTGQTLEQARKLLGLFDLLRDGERFKVRWQPLDSSEGQFVLEVGGVRITASPGVHGSQDAMAVRFDHAATGGSIVYSSDTEPCPAVARLAMGADLLIHEATSAEKGHSSPAQAAEIARQAGVGRLVLIHYPVSGTDLEDWRRQAAAAFPGPVALAQDGDVYSL